MGIHKTTALTFSLCKLNNFLLDEKKKIVPQTSQDSSYGTCRVNIGLEPRDVFTEKLISEGLLWESNHLDNVDYCSVKQEQYKTTMNNHRLHQDYPVKFYLIAFSGKDWFDLLQKHGSSFIRNIIHIWNNNNVLQFF